jgi:glycosyltransferase involved in cell wall biosynthesis
MSAALPRILLVNHTCRLSSGPTRGLLLILKYLRSKYSFIVAAPFDSDELPSALLEHEIPIYPLRRRFFGPFRTLLDLIPRQQCNLVYANNLSARARQAFWAAKFTRRPFVWHIRERVRRRRYAWTVRYSDAVIANSKATAEAVTSVAGYQSPVVIPNGIDPLEFETDRAKARDALLTELRWPEGTFVIINVGHLCSGKNQIDAIDVAARVMERHGEARLLCLGAPTEAGYAERLRERISQASLSGRVRLLGARPNPSDYLRGADLLLHTSTNEPQGRVILEAMAAELPVVAYSVGGIPEAVVEDKTGFLVPVGDIAAAAEAVCRLISDPELRLRMGKAGHARVMQHFTAEATARLVDNVIQSVLLGRRQAKTEAR